MTAPDPLPREGRAKPIVTEDGPWLGISAADWIERIARGSTPRREYDNDGSFRAWIREPERVA